MDVENEYLVFAEAVSENFETGIMSVKLYDDFYIAPVFCYEERQNMVIPLLDETTYVPYKDVMDNKFFVTSEEALRIMTSLKDQMTALYSGD